MSDIIFITDKGLCREDFFVRIEKLAESQPKGIILRHKNVSESEYMQTAERALKICEKYKTDLILHNFVNAAITLGCDKIHLPLHVLKELNKEEKKHFSVMGASCHSVEDALTAQESGCTYITAGHVFDTDCKKGLPGRGLEFLQAVCGSVTVPVYAIGGISAQNYPLVRQAGASGVCIMSGGMACDNPRDFLGEFK